MRPGQAGRIGAGVKKAGTGIEGGGTPADSGPAVLFWGDRLRGNRKRSCARDALCQGFSNSRPMAGLKSEARNQLAEKETPAAQCAGLAGIPAMWRFRNHEQGVEANFPVRQEREI